MRAFLPVAAPPFHFESLGTSPAAAFAGAGLVRAAVGCSCFLRFRLNHSMPSSEATVSTLSKKSIPVGGIRVVSNATIPQVRFSIQNIPSLSIAQPIFVELEV